MLTASFYLGTSASLSLDSRGEKLDSQILDQLFKDFYGLKSARSAYPKSHRPEYCWCSTHLDCLTERNCYGAMLASYSSGLTSDLVEVSFNCMLVLKL